MTFPGNLVRWLALATTVIAGVLIAVTLPTPQAASQALTPARPNVLEIMLDDARSDVWTRLPQTAAILQSQGVNFVNTAAADPDCCPSRGATMSGRYPHNNGVRTEADAFNLDQEHTIQSYLSKAGYMTALSGKFLVSWPAQTPPPNFNRYTFIKGGYYNYKALIGTKASGPTWKAEGYNDATYSTNFLTSQMQKYLDNFATAYSNRPWYGLLTYQAPHNDKPAFPDRATPETKYANAIVPPCVDPGEADKSDKPAWIKSWNVTPDKVNTMCQSQERALLSVDDNVSALLTHLHDTGQLANTLVIFTSDNGFMWHENNLLQKFTPYTPSADVPLLLAWPGHLTPGTTDTRRASLVDLLPTILEAAGIQPDPTAPPLDGHSLLGDYQRTMQYDEYFYDSGANSFLPSWASIRQEEAAEPYNGHTLAFYRWYGKDPLVLGPVTAEELYDITVDPKQLVNLLGDMDATNDPPAVVLDDLRTKLETAHNCVGSVCP